MTIGYDPESPPEGTQPHFPPLLRGVEVPASVDPFDKAVADAGTARAEVGDLYWSADDDVMRAAIVLGPEESLADALPVLFAVANGFNDCLGALAPPEVGLLHAWPDIIKVNGAQCGVFQVAAPTDDPEVVPEWLVIGMALALTSDVSDPGYQLDTTALAEEGCGHLSRIRLLESWSRHTLVWINRWQDDGTRPVFEAWLARAEGRGEDGFVGLDEHGGLLRKQGDAVTVSALIEALAKPRRWPLERIK